MLKFIVLVFSFLLKGESSELPLAYVGILIGMGIMSFGFIEIRTVKGLIQRIEMDIEEGKSEVLKGDITELYAKKSKRGPERFYLFIDDLKVRVTSGVFNAFSKGDEIILIRTLYSGTVLEVDGDSSQE